MRDARRIAGLLREFTRQTGRHRALAAVLATLAAGAAAVSVSWWLKLILDGAARGDLRRVTTLAVLLAVTVAVQAVASNLSGLFLAELQFGCGWQVVVRLMEAGSRPPGIEHYERPDLADEIAVLKQHTNFVSGFLPALGEAVALLGRVALTAVLLAAVHPALLLLPLLAVPSIWAGARAEKVYDAAYVASAQAGRLEEHLFRLATTASPAKEVRIFGLGAELVHRRQQAWDEATDTVAGAQLRAGLLRTAGWLPFAAGYLAAVGLVLARAGRGDATPGDVLLVMVLAGQVNGQVAQLLNVVNRSATAVRVVRRFLWLQDYARDAVARGTPADPAPVPANLHTGIDLDHVSFRYAGDGRGEALSDVTLRLRAGSTVAVVGENGAGKTTLVNSCRTPYPVNETVPPERAISFAWSARRSAAAKSPSL